MIRFKSFLLESTGKLRQGIPHVSDLKPDAFHNLTKSGNIDGVPTHKPDGLTLEAGHDENGFYTRTSHSDKMRNKGDYEAAAKAKFGEGFNPEISRHFDRIHHELHSNSKLTNYLASGGNSIRGEIFYKPHGKPTENGEVRFVGTAYDPKKMGRTGSFIAYSQLPENAHHNMEHLKTLGDKNFNIDDDSTNKKLNVDVSDEHKAFTGLNRDVMASRKQADKEAKLNEIGKFNAIKDSVNTKLKQHLSDLKPKWGSEEEGHVIHPEKGSDAPRIKVISDTFKQNKANFKVGQ
jgi:hypothetical protein